MIVKKQMGCRLAGETEVLGENLPQPHFCHNNNNNKGKFVPVRNYLSTTP
jgi:hypothetical protein